MAMRGGDEDRTSGVSALTNEEPLIGMELGIHIVWEVIGKDCCDSSNSVVGKGETSLRHGGHRFGREGASSTKDGDVSCRGGIDRHRGSEIFSSRGSDLNVVGVNGDIVVEWGEKKSVEYFLSYMGGCGRHGQRERVSETASL